MNIQHHVTRFIRRPIFVGWFIHNLLYVEDGHTKIKNKEYRPRHRYPILQGVIKYLFFFPISMLLDVQIWFQAREFHVI